MHILILDDDKSYGALVASACKKLGHRAQIRFDPSAALCVLEDKAVDVVLLDLEMPQLSGLDMARWLRARGHELPIAFCTGTCQNEELIDAAGEMAQVLPKVWTHADLKVILDALEGEARALLQERQATQDKRESTLSGLGAPVLARGTGPGSRPQFEDLPTEDILPGHLLDPSDTIRVPIFATIADTEPSLDRPIEQAPIEDEFLSDQTLDRASLHGADMSPGVAMALGELRRNVARVDVSCSTWSLVRRLCEDLDRGQRMITVHSKHDLGRGDDVTVAVTLPDEMVVSIGGRVRDLRETENQTKRAFSIELTEFGTEETAVLLEACDLHEPSATEEESYDTHPRIPVTQDSVDLDASAYQGEARISWGKLPT